MKYVLWNINKKSNYTKKSENSRGIRSNLERKSDKIKIKINNKIIKMIK